MGNSWFQFKQFHLTQEKSALKVGTDGVLLGAWCDVSGAKQVLDVGTGTGLIALMLAQRSGAQVHAVEISAEASCDALLNFRKSPWSDRLSLFTVDFNRFSDETGIKYDLVVCNPPFFANSLPSADKESTLARHHVALTFLQLITGTKKILSPEGRLAVILPADALDEFRETARLSGFYLNRKTTVRSKPEKPARRILLEFSVAPCFPVAGELLIHSSRDRYSDDFIALTGEFYLNPG